jgi:peptidyl-prolyl cis-trans isomerase B (cyclophilin B)
VSLLPYPVAMSRRLISLLAVLLALVLLAGCGEDDDGTATDDGSDDETTSATRPPAPDRQPTGVTCDYPDDPRGAAKEVETPPTDATVSGEVPVTFETSVGTFNATLDAAATPCTVNSFVSLADQGYFDGTTCHRMTTDGIYVLQCGDPDATGGGGPGYSFADELSGAETYGPGTLAMANAGPDTNGSQFFIVYADTDLPPSYAVFGSVDEATVELVQGVADDGTTPEFDGAPNTPVDLDLVVAE